jgi:hypothetical protein
MEVIDLIEMNEPLEPETIHQLFPKLSEDDIEYLQVLKVIKSTNAVFEDFDVFENAVAVLNHVSPNIELMEGSLPEWIWKASVIIHRLRPDGDYSKDVQLYVKFIYKENGLKFYPPLIGLDNPLLLDVTKKAMSGPFPLSEDFLGIQAAKYLKIQKYLEENE